MTTSKLFEKRWLLAMLMLCLLCSNAGCAKRVTYLDGEHKAVPLTKGQPAPDKGWWLSDSYAAELYEQLPKK